MRIMTETDGQTAMGCAVMQNPSWTLDEVLRATEGTLRCGRFQAVFRGVSTDSRKICPGDLFVAINGDKFDGHDYLASAIAQGAGGVMVSRSPSEEPAVPCVVVSDTLRGLGDLAAFRRRLMKELVVLAITGSSGKTTVKEMCAGILAQEDTVLKTVGNFNNLIGLPLSLLPVDYNHRFAVLEMGMNHPGEIARLTEIADPDIACINNVQAAHLQGLGDVSGVARAKGELFRGAGGATTLVVNHDDREVRKIAEDCRQRKITFGLKAGAMVRATHIKGLGGEGTVFSLLLPGRRYRVKTAFVGRHNVANALAATALALAAGASDPAILEGLAAYTPFDKRLAMLTTKSGIRVINDTYNANPASMLAAFETLADLRRDSRSLVVVGDMLELGEQSVAAHRFLGETAARMKFDYLFACGSFAHEVVEAARSTGFTRIRAHAFAGKDEIVTRLRELEGKGEIGPGDWILVKGSRSMRMETVVAALEGGGE